MAKRARQTLPLPLEYATTCAVADALRTNAAPHWLYSHFPAGEHRSKIAGARLKAMGMQKGWSDFVLISPTGQHYWLELKRGRAALKVEQSRFGLALRSRSVPWAVARSFEEAVAQLTVWGALRGFRVSA